MTAYKPGWDGELTNRQGKEYITVPIEGTYVKAVSGAETMTAFNVNSKHPEEAMKLLNLVYTDKEIYNELLFGIEGEHYKKTGENSVEVIDSTKYDFSAYGWIFGNQFSTDFYNLFRVKSYCRLIQNDNLRVAHDCFRQSNSLSVAF